MRLNSKPIINFGNINNFDYATEWQIRSGEPNRLYFQIVDLDKDSHRYMPTDPSYSVQVIFPAINPANVYTKVAVQASALDNSIWYVDILDTDQPSTGSVQFALTEGSVTRKWSMLDGLLVENVNNGGC